MFNFLSYSMKPHLNHCPYSPSPTAAEPRGSFGLSKALPITPHPTSHSLRGAAFSNYKGYVSASLRRDWLSLQLGCSCQSILGRSSGAAAALCHITSHQIVSLLSSKYSSGSCLTQSKATRPPMICPHPPPLCSLTGILAVP